MAPKKRKIQNVTNKDEHKIVPKNKKAKVVSGDSEMKKKVTTQKTVTRSNLSVMESSDGTPSPYTCWLVKSEPESRFEKGVDLKFSFDDLKASTNQTACWDGVRNYQARNFLRDQMKIGHDVFFYHSNCKDPGIVGLCKVVKESYPDHTQFDSKDPHFDSSSKKDNPKWFMVDVKYVRPLKRFISLAELKKIHQDHARTNGALARMSLFTRARLSVQPVSKEEFDYILDLEGITV